MPTPEVEIESLQIIRALSRSEMRFPSSCYIILNVTQHVIEAIGISTIQTSSKDATTFGVTLSKRKIWSFF